MSYIKLLETLNLVVALSSLAMLAAAAVLLIDHFVFKGKYLRSLLAPYTWPLIILTTLSTVVFSLIYSEYFGFIPCSLCWLQRIAFYPQAILAPIAFWKNDVSHFPIYGIALSVFGFIIATYQYIYQMIPKDPVSGNTLPCLVDGSGADCAEKVINMFGFVTFPFVSMAGFVFLIALYMLLQKQNSK